LNKSEYELFGIALTEWQRGQSFEKFCTKAIQIIGKKRKHILIGICNVKLKQIIFKIKIKIFVKAMKPFVPIENLEWFKLFIRKNESDRARDLSSDSSLAASGNDSDAESTLSQ